MAYLRCDTAQPALTTLLAIILTLFPCGVMAEDTEAILRDVDANDGWNLSEFLKQHCIDCHRDDLRTAGLSVEGFSAGGLRSHPGQWEHVVRRLRVRQMPPPGMEQPDDNSRHAAISTLTQLLDTLDRENPRPGRTDTFRRLTRFEYQNAIRDLLAVEIDATALLPPDESAHGFDNITVSDLSPTLLDRYVSAAQKISRLALGMAGPSADGATIRVPADLTQEDQLDGLPVGTRGGVLIPYTFPQQGEYDIQIRLARDRNEEVEGLTRPHQLELLLENERLALFEVAPPPAGRSFESVDAHLTARINVQGGRQQLGVTFLKESSSLLETKRQPLSARFNMHRHPRSAPAVYQVSITGPHHFGGPGDTESRRRILIRMPETAEAEEDCAEYILQRLMRRAYRRSIAADDLRVPLRFYHAAREAGDFEAGVQAALSAVLVSPWFLFRIEQDPPGLPSGTAYDISDVELASRLTFFLWSSIPDEELLQLAETARLRQPGVLEQQVRRMLADPRSTSLITSFAGQWLYLRNLDSITPDLRLFPDFDQNLRDAFRQETELSIEHILREDLSVLELLRSDAAFLNERLARHYEIPHVYGPRFRRVNLDEDSRRGGLLRQGSILTVTSYATRTSPVLRGHWVLKNLMGAATPPPPEDVPALTDNTVASGLSVRERLAEHRTQIACAMCHDLMDPPGLVLENFDAVGRWRNTESDGWIDASGQLADGTKISGVSGLEQYLLRYPDVFVGTLSEKLLTFALGRGIEHTDGAAVRSIVREAQQHGFRFSAIILSVVNSHPFQRRTVQ